MKWTTGCGAAAGIFVVLIAGCISIGKMNDASEARRVRLSIASQVSTPLTIGPTLPNLGWRTIQPGVEWAEMHRDGGKEADRIWFYRPAGKTTNLPCVLIAPAGSRLFHGMLLGEGDMDEHIPYVKAGFAVVAYELEGPVDEKLDGKDMIPAAKKFAAADAGVKNTRSALDIAEQLPWVNKKRIFLAGHSSAATVALEAAAFTSSRIAGCAAFAPEVDLTTRLGASMDLLEAGGAKGIKSTLSAVSPSNNTKMIKCPLFLFGALDDTTISEKDVRAFANTMRKTNKDVTYESVAHGGHYDSMIEAGIPAAISWMKTK